MIIKYHPVSDFVVVARAVAQDKNLSLDALGLLTYLQSLPPGWEPRRGAICQARGIGRDRLARILADLTRAGYARTWRTRRADGTWQSGIDIWGERLAGEQPVSDDAAGIDGAETKSGEDEGFQLFWKIFGYGVGRADAEREWRRLGPNQQLISIIISAARQEAAARRKKIERGQTPIHAASWLRRRRWEDEGGGEWVPGKTSVIDPIRQENFAIEKFRWPTFFDEDDDAEQILSAGGAKK